MDVLTDVLRVTRASGAMSVQTEATAPWGLRFDASLRAGFHIVTQGTCWLRQEDGSLPLQLVQGDVVYMPHGGVHILADSADRPARDWLLGPPPLGAGARTVLLCGTYPLDTTGTSPLLTALPEVIHVPAEQAQRAGALQASVALLAAETGADTPGSTVVVDRLVDVMLVYLLRAWLARQPAGCGGWLAALHDPQVGGALQLIHAEPELPWTVSRLAGAVGLSRAAFARRFTDLVGQSPLAYVTRWRMTVAATMLRDSRDTLSAIAAHVGYDSEFAFARAFKREHGLAPGRYRARANGRSGRAGGGLELSPAN